MKTNYLILTLLCFFLLSYNLSAEIIYDSKEDTVYLGGYSIVRHMSKDDKMERSGLKYKIYKMNLKENSTKLLLTTEVPIGLHEINNNGYISISVSESDEKIGQYKKCLIICNKEGKILKKINDVIVKKANKYFSWSNEADKIAYVTGISYMERRNPFEPTGVLIYDLESDKETKISYQGVDVNWSKHDDRIYIVNNFEDPSDISVYDPAYGTLKKSDKKGIVFSDDGKYYISIERVYDQDGYSADQFLLYDNLSNKKIIDKSEKDKIQWLTFNRFINNSHLILMWNESGQYKIVDADTRKEIRTQYKNKLIGFNNDITKGVVYIGGGKAIIESLITGEQLYSFEIPTE